jgi:hypothetical protein
MEDIAEEPMDLDAHVRGAALRLIEAARKWNEQYTRDCRPSRLAPADERLASAARAYDIATDLFLRKQTRLDDDDEDGLPGEEMTLENQAPEGTGPGDIHE